mgnify:CR=1 FL=1
MHATEPKAFYKPQLKTPTRKVSIRTSPRVMAGVERIRAAWCTRFPKDGFPTLSVAFEIALLRTIEEFQRKPEILEATIEQFERKYVQANK